MDRDTTTLDFDVHSEHNSGEVSVSSYIPAEKVSVEDARLLAKRINRVADHADPDCD